MKTLLTLTCLCTSLALLDAVSADDKITEHDERKDVAGVDGENREMLAAQEKARETLKTFVDALEKRERDKRYLLKVRLEEGDEVEHVWLEPVKWDDPGLVGILAVDLVSIKKHKKGDVIAPLPSEVSDWVILSEDGSKEGGFTMDVIAKLREKNSSGE